MQEIILKNSCLIQLLTVFVCTKRCLMFDKEFVKKYLLILYLYTLFPKRDSTLVSNLLQSEEPINKLFLNETAHCNGELSVAFNPVNISWLVVFGFLIIVGGVPESWRYWHYNIGVSVSLNTTRQIYHKTLQS